MTTDEREAASLTIRSYTRAVRHPLVLGRVGGYQLPVQLTVPQLIVGALVLVIGLALRPLIAQVVGGRVALVVVAVVVFGALIVAKRVRAQGRNSLQAAAGVVEYVSGSGPRVHGRKVRRAIRTHRPWPTVVPITSREPLKALPPVRALPRSDADHGGGLGGVGVGAAWSARSARPEEPPPLPGVHR